MSIENAAREIANKLTPFDYPPMRQREVAEIIRCHLFPLVKPEEVEREKFYWVKSNAKWSCEIGGWIVFFDDVDEIRGPIPCPE